MTTRAKTRDAAWLVRQHRPDGAPFCIGKFVPHDTGLQIGGSNHDPAANLNAATVAFGMSAFAAEPEIFCSIKYYRS